MNFYFLQEKLHRERSNHMKQLHLDDMFKKIVTSEYPVASSTSDVPYTDGETVNYETSSNPDTQLSGLCD